MDKNFWRSELYLREFTIKRFNSLLEGKNSDGIEWKKDEKMMKIYSEYEKLFRKLIEDGILDIYDMDSHDKKEREEIIRDMMTFAYIGQELTSIINFAEISGRLRYYLIGAFYLSSHEIACSYLRHFAHKINDFRSKKGRPICSDENIEESTTDCLKVFKEYDSAFADLFEDLEPLVRGSIAHGKWKIAEDGKEAYFIYANKKIEMKELARKVAYIGMLINIFLVLEAKIAAEEIKKALGDS